jgi:hypothetical protein
LPIGLISDHWYIKYVRERVGNDVTIPRVLFSTHSPRDLLAVALPTRFVMKSSHGQGHIYLHIQGEPDRAALVRFAEEWLRYDNYEHRGQWCYKDIFRKLSTSRSI